MLHSGDFEISCFLKTTAKKLGGPIHCWSANVKVGGPVSPGPYACCAYGVRWRVVTSLYNLLSLENLVMFWIILSIIDDDDDDMLWFNLHVKAGKRLEHTLQNVSRHAWPDKTKSRVHGVIIIVIIINEEIIVAFFIVRKETKPRNTSCLAIWKSS